MSSRFAFAQVSCALLTTGALLSAAGSAQAESAPMRPRRTALNRPLNGFDAATVERAKAGAARKLRDPECMKLLTDFHDGQGRPLQEALEKWGVGAAEYLQMIPFLDGASQTLCRWSKVDLVTSPGVPRVFVCAQFAVTQIREPWMAEHVVIHEMLHTLGLGENPPSSVEITQRVKGRCQ